MATHLTLPAGLICRDPSFIFRAWDDHPVLVRQLAAVIRRGGQLDPLLVWAERDENDKLTGRHILIDGAQRIKAYQTEGKAQRILVEVFNGDRKEAMLEAVRVNSKPSVGLTTEERTNAAWRLVWDFGYELSKRMVVHAAGVSDATVAKMRRRARKLREAEQEATGNWWNDRYDYELGNMSVDEDDYEQQRRATIEKVSPQVQKALGYIPQTDATLLYDVLERAVGEYALRSAFEHGYEDDLLEQTQVSISSFTGCEMEEDLNSDF